MALEKNQGILGEAARTIDDVTNCLQQGSKLIVATQEIGALVMAAAERALQVQQDIQNEEIKRIYQVDKALKDLVLVAEKAFIFLNKVDDVVWYCGGDAMAAAREDLRFSVDLHQSEGFWGAIWRGYYSLWNMLTRTPDLSLLRDLFEKLEHSLTEAECSYQEFMSACDAASQSCNEAAEICARKAKEAKDRYDAICLVGSSVSTGLVVGAGLLALATGGLVGLGLAAMGAGAGYAGAMATLNLAQDCARSAAAFRNMKGEFEFFVKFAFDLKEGVMRVHVNLEHISTQVDSIVYCMKSGSSIALLQDALKHLNVVCKQSHSTTSKCREDVKNRIRQLKHVYYAPALRQ